MADNEWSEGPTLKFFEDEPNPSGLDIELWLAKVGNSLVAVFKQNWWSQIYLSTLVDNEWSEPIAVENRPLEQIFSMVAIDEKHFALLQATLRKRNYRNNQRGDSFCCCEIADGLDVL